MNQLRGIDISVWQGAIDWPQIKADGVAFAFIKASEGLGGVDPTFAANWAGAKAAGLVRGAYHFTRPELGNPVAQAAHFVATVRAVGDWEPGDLAAGDFETPEGTSDEAAFALTWLSTAKGALGFPPLAYMSQSWASTRMQDTRLAAYPLWLACLDPQVLPAAIGVWPSVAVHQHSWTLRLAGIAGDVDGDELTRTLDGLKALGKPSPRPLVWHVKTTCALKPSPPSHITASLHTCLGGDVVTLLGETRRHVSEVTGTTELWSQVETEGKDKVMHVGWLLSTNLYRD